MNKILRLFGLLLLVGITCGISFTCVGCNEASAGGIGSIDTTKKPQYRYFFKHETSTNDFSGAIDTLNGISANIGRSMSVDEANQFKIIFARQINKLIGKPVYDSTLIK